jgi:hypothetical protein
MVVALVVAVRLRSYRKWGRDMLVDVNGMYEEMSHGRVGRESY